VLKIPSVDVLSYGSSNGLILYREDYVKDISLIGKKQDIHGPRKMSKLQWANSKVDFRNVEFYHLV
jgi:hypothetical protein